MSVLRRVEAGAEVPAVVKGGKAYGPVRSSEEGSGGSAFLDKVDSIVSQEIFQALSGAITQIKIKIRQ